MLSLSPADLGRLPSSSGFAWYYFDLVSPNGDGVVLIWSLGLPFLPRRAADRASALERPSCTISIYRGGREHFYLLSAARPEELSWDPDRGEFRVGASRFSIHHEDGSVHFEAQLDAEIPGGGRIQGRLSLVGRACDVPRIEGDVGTHAWGPIATACDGRASLSFGDGATFDLAGRGYLDGNRSDVPLDALGIDDWRWGRIAFPDRELVYFHLKPERGGAPRALAIEVGVDGRTRMLDGVTATFREGRPSLYGLRHASSLCLLTGSRDLATVHFDSLVDDGPFYQRYLVRAVGAAGEVGHGVAERVVPARIGVPWQLPFIEMRVHRAGEAGSRWLPLFSGPREGRLGRLLRTWARGVAAA